MNKEQQRGNFNVALNGYRGFCALMVYFYHLGSAGVLQWPQGFTGSDAVAFLWSSLRYGVEMFFMISGFVILGSLLRHDTVGSFLQDRVVRIYTAWVPSLVAVTVVCLALNMKMFEDVGALEALGLFTANFLLLPPLIPVPMINQVSWSLSYEWVFYLTAALGMSLYRFAPGRSWDKVLWMTLAALFVCAFPRALFFMTGVIVFKHQDWFAARRHWLRWPMLSLLVFLVAWRYTDVGLAHLSYTFLDMLLDGNWIAALVAFAASLHMFASVCLNASRQFAFLSSRTFQFLGLISYSFYLWHALVMSAVKRIIPLILPQLDSVGQFIVFAVLSLGLAIALAWASWALFENRLARIFRRALKREPMFRSAVSAT